MWSSASFMFALSQVSNEEDRGGHEDDISCVVLEEFLSDFNPLDDAGAARLNQTRRRLFHMPSAAREVTRYEQIRVEEDEVENENILEAFQLPRVIMYESVQLFLFVLADTRRSGS